MTIDAGRVLTDRALVSDEAPAGLHPSGFDPSRECRTVEPDAEDVRLLLHARLPLCPCCEGTPTTFARFFPHSGIYQSYVHCSRCDMQVFKNAHDRDEARRLAITAWSCRRGERAAFKAGWRTNAVGEETHSASYLDGCETVDYDEFVRLGLKNYLNALRDSDENPQGGDGTAPSRSDDSAGPQGIAQPGEHP